MALEQELHSLDTHPPHAPSPSASLWGACITVTDEER